MFFKQININVDLTDIDYRFGTIGRGMYVDVWIDRDTLWLIPNCCYPSREWIVISNRRTRHRAQYECDMMHGRVCSLSFGRAMRPSCSHRRSIRNRRFRSRRLHHLHHSRRRGRECRGVRPNFIRVFEVELPSANSVSLSLPLSLSRALWLITSSVDSNGQWMRWFGFGFSLVGRSVDWLVGWSDRLDE